MTDQHIVSDTRMVCEPGDYAWDLEISFPVVIDAVRIIRSTRFRSKQGELRLTERAAKKDIRDLLVDDLAAPDLIGQTVTITRFTFTPKEI
ncbi:hypothetical protein [Streptomyces malaysiensis]|uniref:hypothetical protein n=1 Tax=Streptomyces malaysiensis TaxID=92644 RepID=UPI0011CD67CF|nr:hypothetical protein [Streptomyces malaysiensis]